MALSLAGVMRLWLVSAVPAWRLAVAWLSMASNGESQHSASAKAKYRKWHLWKTQLKGGGAKS